MRMVQKGLLLAWLTVAQTMSLAGTFSVSPVRIYMLPRDRAVAITLTNEGSTPIALQADIHTWVQQADGTDELTLTEDMILSPPIIKLQPNARQVVRLALLKPADASRQLTYRLVVREVPEAVLPAGDAIQVPISLVLSMPVFITPPPAKSEIACQLVTLPVAGASTGNGPSINCSNSGSAYAQIREAKVQRGEASLATYEGGMYVLPGARKTIELKKLQPMGAGTAELTIAFDDGKSQTFPIVLP